MTGFSKVAALAALTLNTLTTAKELVERGYGPRTSCACYTATTSTSNTACPTFTSLCTTPLCLYLTTSTIPGPNRRCPYTSTTTTNIPCQTACPTGCATSTSTVTARTSCLATTASSTWTPTAITDPPPPPTSTVYGKEGDRCLAFKFPPEPLCGPGLQCVLDDPQVPDIGGVCKPSTSTPTPTQTTGQEGDRCGRFSFPGDPPCGPGLQCVLDDPRIPDAGGFCRRLGYPTPTPTVGVEGDRCGRFSLEGDPPCGPGLVCVLEDPMIPDAGGFCRPSNSTSTAPPTPTATVGAEGDRCGRFSLEGDPPCGPGLTCVLDDPMIPDAGGFCRPSSSTSSQPPTPTPTVGAEGDRCGRFSVEGDPPCGPGLVCVLEDPMIPDAGGFCRPSNSTSSQPPTPTPTVGAEGDRCGRFSVEGDPPCGPGLTCVLENPQVPDLGGFCRVESTTTAPPTPTATVGAEGDKCGRFTFPMDPPCGPGLECFLTDPRIPDLGGVCKRVGVSSSACVGTVTEVVTVTAY